MKTYEIEMSIWCGFGTSTIKAKNEQDAIEKVKKLLVGEKFKILSVEEVKE